MFENSCTLRLFDLECSVCKKDVQLGFGRLTVKPPILLDFSISVVVYPESTIRITYMSKGGTVNSQVEGLWIPKISRFFMGSPKHHPPFTIPPSGYPLIIALNKPNPTHERGAWETLSPKP